MIWLLYAFLVVFSLFRESVAVDENYFTRYKGYSIAKVDVENEEELSYLKRLVSDEPRASLLGSSHQTKTVDVLLPPAPKGKLGTLKSGRLGLVVEVDDLEKAIRKEFEISRAKDGDAFSYDKYQPLNNVYKWIDDISAEYADWIETYNVAYSYEGRTVRAMKISSGRSKPVIWIEGGIHSREWISPATVMYMTHKLLTGYKKDKDVTTILDTFDFYILPVFNVDGYQYTFTSDRLWRKTRSLNDGSQCVGTDPNRNWNWAWCTTGASSDPCSNAYCGKGPFSEQEVRGVADFVVEQNKKHQFVSFMDFHSYGQLWMSPWGHTKDLPKDFDKMEAAAEEAIKALHKPYGTNYTHGNIADIIYEASGSSADWTYGNQSILYSYGVELRDKESFELPADQIIESGEETFEAVKALALHIKKAMNLPTYGNTALNLVPSMFTLIFAFLIYFQL